MTDTLNALSYTPLSAFAREVFEYDESLHPRDEHGHFLPTEKEDTAKLDVAAMLQSVPKDAAAVAAWVVEKGEQGAAYADVVRQWSNVDMDTSQIAAAAAGQNVDNVQAQASGEVLAAFLAQAPVIDQLIYRGVNLDTQLEIGQQLNLNLSSFSRSRDVAQGYADATDRPAVLALVSGARGLPVDGLSSYDPNEQEVISGGTFTVLSVTNRGDDGPYIRLRQL